MGVINTEPPQGGKLKTEGEKIIKIKKSKIARYLGILKVL